ncbi:hypothetical protein Scep_000896 [Stephania cephalantha]|uniref:WRKY domain-containing protein n=1 Tax=Stephania cephalantha TaxID=152367 RepID=A0AAP0L9N7_9MAGN
MKTNIHTFMNHQHSTAAAATTATATAAAMSDYFTALDRVYPHHHENHHNYYNYSSSDHGHPLIDALGGLPSDFDFFDLFIDGGGSSGGGGSEDDSPASTCAIESNLSTLRNPGSSENMDSTRSTSMTISTADTSIKQVKCKSSTSGGKKSRVDVGLRIAFKTKSEVDVMDDGFKWRKYGKKSVKNSPNPRNYYRCSSRGCQVKKRVERDREDSSYVITTYEGVHDHESPCVVYYNQLPLMVPAGWTLQASHSPSS